MTPQRPCSRTSGTDRSPPLDRAPRRAHGKPIMTANATRTSVRSRHRAIQLQQVDAVMHLKTLLLRARLVVDGFLSGLHRSPFFGFSAEFAEYRQYVPGDDVRYVDWKRYGRSDRLQIKRFEDETNLRAVLLVDGSGSMGFGSGAWSKYQYAATLAASLALLFEHQRDAVGGAVFDGAVRTWLPPRRGRRHCRHLLAELEHAQPGGRTDLQGLFDWISQHVRRRSVLVLLSDFLDACERDLAALPYISAAGLDV
ncbi:MAG: DUF58 domain-containing protein, partial [Planctomycetota bacterium]